MKIKTYYVYIMASRSLNLYTGITNSIYWRALQHKRGEIDGFIKRYNINRLVYYEVFHQVGNAIAREKHQVVDALEANCSDPDEEPHLAGPV